MDSSQHILTDSGYVTKEKLKIDLAKLIVAYAYKYGLEISEEANDIWDICETILGDEISYRNAIQVGDFRIAQLDPAGDSKPEHES